MQSWKEGKMGQREANKGKGEVKEEIISRRKIKKKLEMRNKTRKNKGRRKLKTRRER